VIGFIGSMAFVVLAWLVFVAVIVPGMDDTEPHF
jgi:hypothetical protein